MGWVGGLYNGLKKVDEKILITGKKRYGNTVYGNTVLAESEEAPVAAGPLIYH